MQLDHSLISRHHCELYEENGQMMVRDLGSRNGTFIGGQRVETAPVPAGELLTVGGITFRAIYGEDALLAPEATIRPSTRRESKRWRSTKPRPFPCGPIERPSDYSHKLN